MVEQIFRLNDFKENEKWVPQLGDYFPDFEASTTKGLLRFKEWSDGKWCFLFSHPAAFRPVCTTELVALAAAENEFSARNVKLLGFTASPLEEQQSWHKLISREFGFIIDFPIADDQYGILSRRFGMVHENQSSCWPIRKSIVIDPQRRVRLISEYPPYVGRSTDEVLRTLDALQAVDYHDIATPADWIPGEDYFFLEKRISADDTDNLRCRLRRLKHSPASIVDE